nr:MAG TPA: hypothetical protein [Caudoviricetes sp.]
MLVTTKKKIYLCDFGVIDEGVEIDVSAEIIEQFGHETFEGIPVEEPTEEHTEETVEETTEETTEETAEETKPQKRGKKAKETAE